MGEDKSMAAIYNVFKELNKLNKTDLRFGDIIKSMSKFSMDDLYFMRDCIDLMIIYNKYAKEA